MAGKCKALHVMELFNNALLRGLPVFMLIFAVQIGHFDIGPVVTLLCTFNDCPGTVHFQAAKTVVRYLRSTMLHGNVYWRPTDKEPPDP
jgi:hypothetical protein